MAGADRSITETVNTSKSSLKCFIFNFSVSNILKNVISIEQTVANRCLCFHKTDASVEFVHLDRSPDVAGALANIRSVKLNKGSHTGSDWKLTLSVVTTSLNLAVYSYHDNALCCLATVPVKDLVPQEIDVGSSLKCVEVVHFLDDLIVLKINEKILLSLQFKDGRLTPLAAIEMPGSHHGNKDFQVIQDIAAVYQIEAQKIFLYSLWDGRPLTTIDTCFLNISPESIQTWQLSDDLKVFVLVTQSGDLIHVDLEKFVPGWSGAVQKDRNGSMHIKDQTKPAQNSSSSLNTCRTGESAWREKLLSLHQRSTIKTKSKLHKMERKGIKADKRMLENRSRPNITGFKCQSQRRRTEAEDSPTVLAAPRELQGYSIEGVSIGSSILTLVYTYNDVSVLCFCDVHSGSWSLQRFTECERILLAVSPSMPHMVVTETHLLCVLTDQSMDQEQFVSELMVYAGGTVADAVCQINNWGRCSLPIHTLEIGLKHRQVDTVTSFLKSKQNFFTAGRDGSTSLQLVDSLPWASHNDHYDNLIQLEPALHLLLQSARGSMGDKLAQVFAKQILDTTMDFLYGLLLDGLGLAETLSDQDEKDNLHKATEKLLEYIEETRNCIRQLEARPRASRTESVSAGSLSAVSVSNLSMEISSEKDIYSIQSADSRYQDWEDMEQEAAIESGILTNRIPELQQYLYDRGESARGDYSYLEKIGVNKAVTYMRANDMERARELLSKLGLDVSKKLWEIALHTLDMVLCDMIIEELRSLDTLNPDQVAVITFLQELNRLYPHRNFESLRDRQHHPKDSGSAETVRLRQLTSTSPKFDLAEHCSNLAPGMLEGSAEAVEEQETGTQLRYNEVMLDWVQHWNKNTRDLIKLDVLLYTQGSDLEAFSKETIWEYLQSYNMADVMIDWIHSSYHGNQKQQSAKWPTSHLGVIPVEFVDQLDSCPSYTKWKVLKAFASHGVFDRETAANFSQLLQMINETGGILRDPHPLLQCPYTQIHQFHLDLVQYCVEHDLPHLLWSYCSTHRVKPEFLQNLSEAFQSDTWLPVFTQFYALTDEKNYGQQLMYDASVSNAVSVWGKDLSCVGEMIQQGHILAALATLMYSSHQLQQVTFVTQQMEAFDGLSSETVERAIQAFPKLRVTLFPAAVSDSTQLDISVYQLLVGNAPFDPSRLFGWQSTNHIAGEDAPKEMPYFSQSQLVAQFAHSEQLRYPYYLKQGRPSFAFLTFLAEEFKTGAQTVSHKRLMVALGTSLWIGVKNFHHTQISSACVVFQELLGHDSVLLRTYIQVGNVILSHKNNAVTGPMDKRREMVKNNETEIVELLLNCVQNSKHYGPIVLQALEAAILESVTRDRLSPSQYECGERWSVAVLFCQLMRLPYTTVFLESCAQTNKWLPFIWFAQMHQYSKEQLQNILHLFKSPHLQEHLRYVLVNADIRSSEEEEKVKLSKKRSDNAAKDVRSTLYSRIGLSIEKDSDGTSTEEEDQQNVLAVGPAEDDSDDIQVSFEGSPGDVFGVIFAAQGSKSTYKSLLLYCITLRNPLFAELAASEKDSTTVSCLCSWLVSMMDVNEHSQFLENYGKLPWKYSLQTLDAILDIFVWHKWGSVLVTGFDIYQQTSPLLPFLQFYSEFTEKQNFDTCKLFLDEFKECVFQFHHENSVKSGDQIGNSDWLESTTYRILHYMLTCSDNVYEVTQLLKILDSESITLIFSKEDPDFRKQFKMMQVIQSAGIQHVDCAALFSPMSGGYYTECKHITSLMMSQQLYDVARKFAAISETPADHITLEQVEKQKEKLSSSQLWLSLPARFKFYRGCADKFQKYGVSGVKVVEYFEKESNLTENKKQKAFLYELCLACCKGDNSNEDLERVTAPDLYRKMWLYRIQEKVEMTEEGASERSIDDDMFGELELTNQKTASETKQEMTCYGKMPHPNDKPHGLSDKETAALKNLLVELLENGKVSESCRVATEFSLYSQDLAIILTCIRLSLGVLSLDQFEPDMLHLLRTEPGSIHRQSIAAPVPLLRNSSAISLVSNIQPVIDILSEENEEKIFVMERLLKHCERGVSVCRRIITAFKIAAVLCVGYDDVALGDDYTILKSLLKTECSGKFRLAQDFLATSSLSSAEVAGFLSDAIIQSYRVSLGDGSGDQELLFDPGENFADFHQIVRLCQEPSLLGDRLLSALASMADCPEEISDKVLTLQTEVLILAHECHTAACNMEGISNILRAARILTSYLESSQEFSLMTRLLTGIGRYNEMIYIFDVLKQNHQFELLLGKGMEKETKLKTAVLDYLKRYHPGDTETYSMVALNLMMYREIAQQLENKAVQGLDRLKGKPLENNGEVETQLRNITQYFSEAAESYIKDNCLRHAQTCVRKARLVALQLKHLPSNQQFINLTTKGANLLIADHPVFSEAYIVSEAYGKRDNWASALCTNVIIRGDMKYLQEFRSHLRLAPGLVQDAVERYQQLQDKPVQAVGNIKKLLGFCKDIKLQYRLARDLGIKEIISILEKGDSRSYFQDFVSTLS